ncbi:HD domain-containing protein [Patescibacteria group bacterium]|nr:HD domain-containing protein [Patescibacteria group bacterium]
MEKLLAKLETRVQDMFHGEKSGHDIYHLKRTLNLALKLQEKEGGDRLVIGIASYLHDIHRIIQNETGKRCSPKDSLPKVTELLNDIEITEEQKEKILHCIEYHEEYAFSKEGVTVDDIESLIVQDADNLDGIGAIGIGRTFTYNGAHGVPMWEPDIPFADDKNYDDKVHDPSAVHHFRNKLMRLADNMNTKTGKKMARSRHKFMEEYLEEFFKEWEGKM